MTGRSILYLSILAFSAIADPARAGTKPEESAAVSSAQAIYVDVRTPEEFSSGHVTRAINIPYDQMEKRWKELEAYKDRRVILYCRSGRRSGIAMKVLEKQGFSKLENGGGLDQLVEKGVATER